MARSFSRAALVVAAILVLTASAAMADTLTLQNGGTVTGSFVYNPTNNTVVTWDFTTTAGGGFGGEVYSNTNTGSGAVVLTNQDQDQVFGFDAVQAGTGEVDELDIVLSCAGVANCATQAISGNSYAITAGFPPCPNPGTTTGFCIASGLQNQVPGGLEPEDLLTAGNFITITDPPAGDLTFNLSTTSTGTIFNGGGGTTNTPEPSSLLLMVLGLGAILLLKFRTPRRMNETPPSLTAL